MTAAPARQGRAGVGRGALVVLAVAVATRAVALVQAQGAPFWSVPVMDEAVAVQLSQALLAGQAPPHGAFYQAPGYAAFLAVVRALGGSIATAKLLQMAAGVASSLLVWELGRRFFGRREAALAGLLWAVYPVALFHELLLLKPTLAVLLSLLALVLITPARAPVPAGRASWAAGGVCLGLAAVTQADIAGVALLCLAVSAWASRRGWPGAPPRRSLLAAVLGWGLVVAVPTAANAWRGGGLVVVAYGGGTNFFIGNHAGADGSYVPLRPFRSDSGLEETDAVQLARAAAGRPLTAPEVSRYWWGRGLSWWREQPGAALRLTVLKLGLVWGPQEQADVLDTALAARFMGVLQNPVVRPAFLLPLALVALWATRRRRELWLLRAFVVASTAVLVPFFVFERFRLPLTAVCLPFGAHALVVLADALRARRLAAAATGLAAAGALALLLGQAHVTREREVMRANLGNMFLARGRHAEALEEFRAVRAARPGAWRVEMNVAFALAGLGRREEALRSLAWVVERLREEERATGLRPVEELVHCHVLAGDLQLSAGRAAEAAASYRAALALLPGHRALVAKLARATTAEAPAAAP